MPETLPVRVRIALILGPAVICILGAYLVAPIPQWPSYHNFYDARSLFAIPNFWNVVSNLPFVGIGAAGLVWLARTAQNFPANTRLCYQAMFAGVMVTGLGSSYYHWAPDNTTLFWDRLPIAVSLMAMFAGLVSERLVLKPRAATALLMVLLAFGAGSVLYWHVYDDLRFYVIAQFYPLLAIPLILWWFPPVFTRGADWLVALGFYIVAKAFEFLDGQIFSIGQLLSGHSLKHVSSAFGIYWIYRMLKLRREIM